MEQHDFLLGTSNGNVVALSPTRTRMLVASPSGGDGSTLTRSLLARIATQGQQFCLLDSEEAFLDLPDVVQVGVNTASDGDAVVQHLSQSGDSVVVNLLNLPIHAASDVSAGIVSRIVALQGTTGRPVWVIVNQAHRVLPIGHADTTPEVGGCILITDSPDAVATSWLRGVNAVIAPANMLPQYYATYAKAIKVRPPKLDDLHLQTGDVLLWRRGSRTRPVKVSITPTTSEQVRPRATIDISEHEHFFFVGPHQQLSLRAWNLGVFVGIAAAVDDETWDWHLKRGDYTNWFRHVIRDDALADAAEQIRLQDVAPAASRQRVRQEIEKRYTLSEPEH